MAPGMWQGTDPAVDKEACLLATACHIEVAQACKWLNGCQALPKPVGSVTAFVLLAVWLSDVMGEQHTIPYLSSEKSSSCTRLVKKDSQSQTAQLTRSSGMPVAHGRS